MDNFLEKAQEIALEAGEKLLTFLDEVDGKVRAHPKIKTAFDEITDSVIKGNLEKFFPEHSYLTEETGFVDKKSDYLWIIDPLDGTGNFLNKNPFFAVSIALFYQGKPLLGVLEAPRLRERYYAYLDKGAFLLNLDTNKTEKVLVSENSNLKSSFFVYCEGGEEDKMKIMGILDQYYPKVTGMRILGSAAMELAWVGLGRADAYISPRLNIWDIAAGMLFVSEAGGKILDFKLNSLDLTNIFQRFSVVATNGRIPLSPINY